MNDRKIVFVNQATGYLTIDIINEFAKEFQETVLVTGSIRVQDIPLDPKVKISWITLYKRNSNFQKLKSWLLGTIRIYFQLLFKYRNHEIFYITIPPSAYLLSLFFKNKFSLLVFDVYPDVLKIFKIGESSLLYRSWVKWNKKLFARAHRLYTIGTGMKVLLSKYIESNKIDLIPLWSGLTKIHPIEKSDNIFIKQNKIEGKFIVQYSGNIGATHNIEILVKIAAEMTQHENILFLIIGRGDGYKNIASLIEKNELKNCMLLPFQPDDMLNYSLAAADLGVVILDDKVAHASMPSKIYNMQAVGVPLLAISDLKSEVNTHIEKYKIGKCFTENNFTGIKDFIIKCESDQALLESYKKAAKLAAKEFTIHNAKKYLDLYVSQNQN